MPSTSVDILASLDRARLASVCNSFGVRKLSIFGSVARGDARDDSDIDVMYELQPGRTISLFRLVDLADALSPMFDGRRVDLCRETQLNPIYLDEVRRETRVAYEE
jgi:predicted nucleotidyltransferase